MGIGDIVGSGNSSGISCDSDPAHSASWWPRARARASSGSHQVCWFACWFSRGCRRSRRCKMYWLLNRNERYVKLVIFLEILLWTVRYCIKCNTLWEQSLQEPCRQTLGPRSLLPAFIWGSVGKGWQRWYPPGVDSQRLNLRQVIRVGAWNISSLRQDDRLPLLSRELKRLRVEVAALLEVGRPGSGTISVAGYTYYWLSRYFHHYYLQG